MWYSAESDDGTALGCLSVCIRFRTPLQRKTRGESTQPEAVAQVIRPHPDHAARPFPQHEMAQNLLPNLRRQSRQRGSQIVLPNPGVTIKQHVSNVIEAPKYTTSKACSQQHSTAFSVFVFEAREREEGARGIQTLCGEARRIQISHCWRKKKGAPKACLPGLNWVSSK